jgi:hypothetical protein
MQYKVYFFRERIKILRCAENEQPDLFQISSYGGLTVAIKPIAENTFSYAIAYCNEKDRFVKKIGRDFAAEKLGNSATLFKSQYTNIFDVYTDLLLKIKNGTIKDDFFHKYMKKVKKNNKYPKFYTLFVPQFFYLQPNDKSEDI